MALTSPTSRINYPGSGTTGPFSFGFRIFQAADLKVTMRDATNAEHPYTLNVDYTVTGVSVGADPFGGGGQVTLTVPLAVGQTLTIRRSVQLTQLLSIQNQGSTTPKNYEDAYDHAIMAIQDLQDQVARAAGFGETVDPATVTTKTIPSPNQMLGIDATGTKIISTPGVPGPPGSGIPVFANPAARDAAFPAPGIDTIAIVKSLGYQLRFGVPASGGNKWLPTGLTRDAGPVITSNSQGLVGDGVVDDSTFLQAADTAAVASGGRHELDLSAVPTRVYINSNVTLAAPFRPNPGAARIYVGTGKTLTINGAFDPGYYGVFDPTMPGTVVFAGRNVHHHLPHWYGAQGNDDGLGNGHDDTTAWTYLAATVPNSATVFMPPGFKSKMTGGFAFTNRQNITITSYMRLGNDNQVLAPQFNLYTDIGSTPMIKFNYCRFPTVEGIVFQPNGHTTRILSFDGSNSGFIGTTGRVRGCYFNDQTNLQTDITAIAISETEPTNNHEYYEILDNFCLLGTREFTNGTVTRTGANTWSFTSAYHTLGNRGDGNPVAVGQRVRIALQATASGTFALDTTIASVNVGAGTFTTLGDATPASTNTQCIIGGDGDAQYPFCGTFVLIGSNPNSKKHLIAGNQVNKCRYAVHMKHGSFESRYNKFQFCEKILYVENAAEEIISWNDDTETCATFADMNGQVPFSFHHARWAVQFMDPVNGYLKVGGTNNPYLLTIGPGNQLTQPVPTNCRLVNLDAAGQVLVDVYGNNFFTSGTGVTKAKLGLDQALYANPRPVRLGPNGGLLDDGDGALVLSTSRIRQLGVVDHGNNPMYSNFDAPLAVNRWNNGGAKWPVAWWTGSTTVTPGTIAAGATYTTDITITGGGAQLADANAWFAGFNVDLGSSLVHFVRQVAFNDVRVYIYNPTAAGISVNGGGAININVVGFHIGAQ